MSCTGITHEQKIYVIACNIAEDIQKMAADDGIKKRVEQSLFVLSMMVKDEDHKRAKELIKEHVSKCECAVCKSLKDAVIQAIEQQEETPLDNSRADDSFAV